MCTYAVHTDTHTHMRTHIFMVTIRITIRISVNESERVGSRRPVAGRSVGARGADTRICAPPTKAGGFRELKTWLNEGGRASFMALNGARCVCVRFPCISASHFALRCFSQSQFPFLIVSHGMRDFEIVASKIFFKNNISYLFIYIYIYIVTFCVCVCVCVCVFNICIKVVIYIYLIYFIYYLFYIYLIYFIYYFYIIFYILKIIHIQYYTRIQYSYLEIKNLHKILFQF